MSADYDALRQEYNAAVANGLLLRARRIGRVIEALERAQTRVTSPAES